MPQIISPHRSRLIGADMPIQNVKQLTRKNLIECHFISGHELYSIVDRGLLKTKNSFFFGFARPGHLFLDSALSSLTKSIKGKIDYEKLNESIQVAYDQYINSAEALFKLKNGVLLRSDTEAHFYGALSYLGQILNMPVPYSPARNKREVIPIQLDQKKIIKLNLELLGDIHKSAKSLQYNILKSTFNFIAELPPLAQEIREIYSQDYIELRFDRKYIIWINNTKVKKLSVRPLSRVDKVTKKIFSILGSRADLLNHQEMIDLENLALPVSGIGFALRYPFNSWKIDSNLKSEVIGRLYEYEIRHL